VVTTQFGGVGGIHRAKVPVAPRCRDRFAVPNSWLKSYTVALRHVGLHGHFRCAIVSRPMMKFAVGIRGGLVPSGSSLPVTYPGCIRIADGGCLRGGCSQRGICASHQIHTAQSDAEFWINWPSSFLNRRENCNVEALSIRGRLVPE